MYIETNLTLDSFDLVQIQHLLKLRIDELKLMKIEHPARIHQMMCDEQIHNYTVTKKKIDEARKDVKRVKAEADAAYYASRKV